MRNKFSLVLRRILHSSVVLILPVKALSKRNKKILLASSLALILILIPLIFYLLKHAGVTEAAWFDQNFSFRQRVDITNSGSAQTDFQVVITLNTSTLITAGKMQSDCDDIRIVDLTGKLLPFWTETGGSNGCNTTTTKIWTKVPSIPTSDQTVYIYYGNPSAAVKSDISWMPTGGTITLLSDGHRVHKFTTSSTFTTTANVNVETLVVAGGGGGGMDMGGGGGGGGVISNTAFAVTTSPITVTVGEGGAGAPAAGTGGQPAGHQYTIPAQNGQNSVFGTQTAIGGGFGGSSYRGYTPGISGNAGGSGGGSGGYNDNAGTFYGGAGTSGQGNRGGNSINAYYSGGGGGAGAQGTDSNAQPDGGIGVANNILGTSYYWGGGGGGASYSLSTGGNGGNGGGGGGALGTTTGGSGLNSGSAGGGGACCSWANTPGGNAGANTGGGGGGGSHYNANNKGGDGGSGIVVVRYPSATGPSIASPTNEENGPGPVGYWKFDEGTGTSAKDSSQYGSTGTFGASTAAPTWITEDQCISSKCLRFDGSNDYLEAGNNSRLSFGTEAFSLNAWIKTSYTGGYQHIVGKRSDASTAWYRLLIVQTTGKAAIELANSYPTNYLLLQSTTNVADGKWHYISATRNGSGSVSIYVDGKLENTGSANYNIDNAINISIGTYSTTNNPFNGAIDDVRIYNYLRSAAQVKVDYNSRGGSGGNVLGNSDANKNLSNGLVGYWKMDEASGNLTDSSGNSYTGTVTGTTVAAGKFGNGRTLNGTTEFADIGDRDMVTGKTLTVSAWIKTTGQIDQYEQIIGKNYNAWSWALQGDSTTNKVRFFVSANSYNDKAVSNSTLNDGVWHHIVGVYDGNLPSANIKMYVDGVLQTTTADKTIDVPNTSDRESIGAGVGSDGSNAYYFPGTIDEARVYNRALSPNEVSQLYNFAPGPLAYYNFDEGSGTTLNDKSGNDYNSTGFSGTPNWDQGKFGKALYFDGSTNSVTLPVSVLAKKPKKITFEIWLKGKDQPTNSSIFAAHPSQKVNVHAPWSDSNMYWDYGEACCNGRIYKAMPSNYMNNNWTHFAFTADMDANFMQIYANGVLWHSGTVTANTMVNAPTSFYLGSYDGTNYKYKGWMDEFKIYDYVRTPGQIVEDMNADHPLGGSPVGSALLHLKFDEGYGTTTNNSGNGGSTYNGTITSATFSNNGKFSKALHFNGATAHQISIPAITSLTTGTPFTISAWVNPTNTGDYRTILGYDGTHRLLIDSNGRMLSQQDGNFFSLGNGDVPNGTWTHVMYWNNGTEERWYINGKQSGSSHTTALAEWNGAFKIGQYDNANYPYSGLVDEVKVYSGALTPDQIKLDYNHGASQVMGAMSNTSGLTGGNVASNSASAAYCVPGDTATCSPPAGEWNFEEKSGTSANDTSGNGITGSITSGTPWVSGKLGSAVQLNGSSQSMELGAAKFDTLTSATVELWFYYTGSFAGNNVFFSRYKDGNNRMPVFVSYPSAYGNKIAYENIVGGSNRAITSDNTISANAWYHVALICGTGGMQMYVNGIKQAATNATTDCFSTIAATTSTSFGAHNSGAWFPGKIDGAKMYNYVRTPAQIAWDYNRGAPVGWWKFDECQGGSAYDSSGNGNSGTITIGGSGTQTSVGTCTTASTAWGNGATGKYNASLNFDGTDDLVTVGNLGSFYSQGTLSFWVNASEMANYRNPLTTKYNGGNAGIRFEEDASGNFVVVTGNDAGTYDTGTYISSGMSTSAWYHIVYTWNTSTNWETGFLNGKQVFSNSHTLWPTTIPDLRIGTGFSTDAGRQWKGQIDDARVYNYALTKQQVQQVYNQGGAVRYGPLTGSP